MSTCWPCLPGTGKTHALYALGHRLLGTGHSVLFAPAYRLVQELLAAKRDLVSRRLRKLDNYDFLLLDDLAYLLQGAEESEVLFTLIAKCYERRSLGITSNLVFSEWERIFANPMATVAAIDRVVHHSVILEFAVPSYRTDAAQQHRQPEADDVGEGRRVLAADADSDAAEGHGWLSVFVDQSSDQGRAGRCREFADVGVEGTLGRDGGFGGGDDSEGGRRGVTVAAGSAWAGGFAEDQRSRVDALDAEVFQAVDYAYYVDEGVGGAEFVEVNLIRVAAVDAGFGGE